MLRRQWGGGGVTWRLQARFRSLVQIPKVTNFFFDGRQTENYWQITGTGGEVDGRHSNDCKRNIGTPGCPDIQIRRGEARAHLLPRPGRTWLPRPLGYNQLPQPVRVRSWGGWVRNRIKVYNFYHRLPRPLGYTRLPRPLGYTRLPRPVRVCSWGGWVRNGIKVYNLFSTIRIIIRPSEKWDCTNSSVWHIVNPFVDYFIHNSFLNIFCIRLIIRKL